MKSIIVLPAKGCRRSAKIIKYLQEQDIPFERIDLGSSEGEALMAKHHFLASPGILVDGISINPYALLIQEECRIDEENLKLILDLDTT